MFMIKHLYLLLLTSFAVLTSVRTHAQRTIIRGFVDAEATYHKDTTSFGLGEQDLFITSQLTDHISFLGESVFKFSAGSPTTFAVSIERIVLKYNYIGNHSIIFGKVHTPLNYWNYTYHHGRVFFPTIDRPLLFAADIIPLHTMGIAAQGQNLGKYKFGYDLMVGNGIGSSDVADNDTRKSLTASVRVNPMDGLTVGGSWYNDVVARGAKMHDGSTNHWKVKQNLLSGTVAYFGNRFELLAEGSMVYNHTDTTGTKRTLAGYVYGGVKIKEKWVPYFRVDRLSYQQGEVYYHADNTTSIVGGLRYEINYLSVVKLEYQHTDADMGGKADKVVAQFAIGF